MGTEAQSVDDKMEVTEKTGVVSRTEVRTEEKPTNGKKHGTLEVQKLGLAPEAFQDMRAAINDDDFLAERSGSH